ARADQYPEYYPRTVKEETKRSLFEVGEVLKRGRWLILAISGLFFMAAMIYTFLIPPSYEASSLLIVESPGVAVSQDALAYGFVEATSSDAANKSTQALILQQSLQIAERTIDRLHSMETVPATGRPIEFINDESQEGFTNIELANLLQEKFISIDTEGDWRVGALRITARSGDSDEASLIANTYADEYVMLSQETSRERISTSRKFLEEQLEKEQAELDTLEAIITRFKQQEGAVDLDATSALAVSHVATLEASREESRIEVRMRQASLRSLEEQLAEIHPQLLARLSSGVEAEIESTQMKIAELELKVEPIYLKNPELRTDPSDDPYLVNLVNQLAQLKSRVEILSQEYISGLEGISGPITTEDGIAQASSLKSQIVEERIGIESAQARISAIDRALRVEGQRLQNLPAQSVRLAQLERRRLSAEGSVLFLEDKLQEARIAEEAKAGFARIIRPALPPIVPVSPSLPRNAIMGVMLGLMLGIITAVGRHWMDSHIYGPADIRSKGLKLIGAIPDLTEMIREDFKGSPTFEKDGAIYNTGLVGLLAPVSPAAESYRRLYVNLQFSVPDRVVQTILVTSPEAEVGKSTSALNLALTAARSNRKTLVIDADFHRPTIAKYLGGTKTNDVRKLLRDVRKEVRREREANGHRNYTNREVVSKRSLNVSVEQFKTDIENLYVLAPSNAIENSGDFLGSIEFRYLLDHFRSEFDVIVIDTPPVLLTTDAALLATQCDAALVVVAAGQSDIDALEHSVNELESIGANITGVLLNRFDPSEVSGYKHTYGYRYKYYNEYYRPRTGEKASA
ncbi:MAG: polysaccharide biosynthesis tyrosine autokinase, partial [Rhodothermales bacterium]|nr:polysaccharide biosynthesis tyrosine autokinase [Rhodothermales bacterium]